MKGLVTKDSSLMTHLYRFTFHCITELHLSGLRRGKYIKTLAVRFLQLLAASVDMDRVKWNFLDRLADTGSCGVLLRQTQKC